MIIIKYKIKNNREVDYKNKKLYVYLGYKFLKVQTRGFFSISEILKRGRSFLTEFIL